MASYFRCSWSVCNYFRFLISIILTFCFIEGLYAEDAQKESFTELEINFEDDFSKIIDHSFRITNHGGRIIPDGIVGKAIRLPKKAYLSIESKKAMGEAGSIVFWVRPHWSYYDRRGDVLTSHTFISFKWLDSKNGYFAVSDGWWEPAGSLKTYFVLDNNQHAHTSAVHKYINDYWMQIACVWDSGTGMVQLFIDGKLANHTQRELSLSDSTGPVYIGSDMGTPMAADRWADCDIDELSFFNQALSSEAVENLYRLYDPNPEGRYLTYLKQSMESSKKVEARTAQRVIRAIFDEGTGWMTSSGAIETIERIKRAGFNVYIPCVWHGQGTRYPSAIAPPKLGFDFNGDDPLSRLIEIAHASGIEVHPWFCVALRQRDFLKDYWATESPQNAFDLQRPEFRSFISKLVLDVVKRYNIDGINLDYIRTMGICTCKYCLELYNTRYGGNLIEDKKQRLSNGALKKPVQDWVDKAVAAIVSEISKQARIIKKDIEISVCGYPTPSFLPPSPEGRNEVSWVNGKFIDIVYYMDYSHKPDYERFTLARDEFNEPDRLLFLIGNYDQNQGIIKPRAANFLTGHTSFVQNLWHNGFGIYLYSQLSEEQILSLNPLFFQESIQTNLPK